MNFIIPSILSFTCVFNYVKQNSIFCKYQCRIRSHEIHKTHKKLRAWKCDIKQYFNSVYNTFFRWKWWRGVHWFVHSGALTNLRQQATMRYTSRLYPCGCIIIIASRTLTSTLSLKFNLRDKWKGKLPSPYHTQKTENRLIVSFSYSKCWSNSASLWYKVHIGSMWWIFMSLRELNSLIFLDMKICRRVCVKFPVYQDDSASNFFILPDLLHLNL